MSEPAKEPTSPPKFGCLGIALLLMLVALLIGISVCGNMNFGTR